MDPTVHRAKARDAGGCNFCVSDTVYVWVVRGRCTEMRLCHTCYREIRRQVNAQAKETKT